MSPDFYGLPTHTLSNGVLRLEYLATAGPRLVRLFVDGVAENQLAEVPGWGWDAAYGRFLPYGGHRLWHAPEAVPRTYVPDNEGLTVEELTGGVRLVGPVEAPTGIRKSIVVQLHPSRPALTLLHSLENAGAEPVELAPWAITQLPLGGVALLPQPLPATDSSGVLPNRNLVLWPYSRLADDRLHLGDAAHWIAAQPRPSPLKVGYLNGRGWIAYYRQGVLFCKRFAPQVELLHPDMNCNVEVYCNDRVVELETLAPLGRLEPGQQARHTEDWEWYAGREVSTAPEELRQLLCSLGL
jgi:hypothetical protein